MISRGSAFFLLVVCLSVPAQMPLAQMRMKKVSEPPGETLGKARRASTLGQAGSKPFHVRVEIAQTKGPAGEYAATIEETWVSETRWVRTVRAKDFTQTTVADGSGLHFATEGEYSPAWLRNFVTAVFTPVTDPPRWGLDKAPIEHVEFPSGQRSSPCQHAEFAFGVSPVTQVNFANFCFRAQDGLLEMAQSPDYTMEFRDYAAFGKLHIARTLVEHPFHGVELTGKVVTLEQVSSPDPAALAVPAGATGADAMEPVTLSAETMLRVANGTPALAWPSALPGKGMFTAWVELDRQGKVREAHSLNSDESGLAADMTAQLVGLQWKPVVVRGVAVQAQGPLVFTYPAASSVTGEGK